jgi:hypothetical protein
VAGNVSGPVDLLTLALRKLGIPVPEDSVGSSAWMQRQGLTRPVQQSATSLAGETFGLLAPIAAAAKAPQIAKGLLNVADNAGEPGLNAARRGQMGATVWHGSPHKFDKFDSSKINTGQGAQMVAPGTYTGGAQATGEAYRNTLAPGLTRDASVPDDVFEAAKLLVKQYMGSPSNVLANAKPTYEPAKKAIEAMRSGAIHPKGYLYKVDLPDEHIAKMLDWDKPLSQQAPEVRKALNAMGYKPDAPDVTGSQVLMDLAFKHGDEAKATEALRNAGVPGARYLDGVSRGSGEGSSNYVVFPGMEHIMKILERNGIPIR